MLKINNPATRVEIPGNGNELATAYRVEAQIKILDQDHNLLLNEGRAYVVWVPPSKEVLLNTEIWQAIKQSVKELWELVETNNREVTYRVVMDTVQRLTEKEVKLGKL